jgi:hypothetical protein
MSVLENIKIYIKDYIKIAPTCFGLRLSSGSLHMSLDKVTFIKSVKVRRYGLCGCAQHKLHKLCESTFIEHTYLHCDFKQPILVKRH